MASEEDSDSDDLQRRYKAGDPTAFAELWAKHNATLKAWGRPHLMGDDDLTEDLLNETALKLWTSQVRSSYEASQPWLPWAFRVFQNAVKDFHRKRSRRKEVPIEHEDLPANPAVDADLRVDIDDCLARLPSKLRDLLQQRYIDGRKQKEIAGTKGSTSGVSRNLALARKRLAECLDGKMQGERPR